MFVLAILFPPLAVLMTGRFFSFLANLALCLLLWIPGMIHACVVVADWKAQKRHDDLIWQLYGR